MTVIAPWADISLRDRYGSLIAVVQVRALRSMSVEAATHIKDFVLDGTEDIPYFVLVTEDRVFVWRLATQGATSRPLACSIEPVIARYFPSRTPGARVSRDTLRFITELWLMDLVGFFADQLTDEASQCLATSGLAEAVSGGSMNARSLV